MVNTSSNLCVTLRYDDVSHTLGILIGQARKTKATDLWIFTGFGLRSYVRFKSKCMDADIFQIYGRIYVIFFAHHRFNEDNKQIFCYV